MIKNNKKRVSILLVLAMVMTMLTGLAAPAAASTPVTGVVIGHVPTVVATGDTNLANIRFAESGASIGNVRDGDTITVTLPSGVVFQAAAFGALFTGTSVTAAGSVAVGASSVTLTLDRVASILDAASFALMLPVTVNTVGSGPINVTLTTNTTAISGGTFDVGTFSTAAVTVDGTGTVGTVSRFVGTPQNSAITVRLRENAAGALRVGVDNRVVLTLPAGATWAVMPTTLTGGITAVIDGTDARRLNVSITSATTSATTFTLSGISVNVNRLAALGDLTVTVTGEGTNAGVTGSVVLARVADFDITVRRPAAITTPPTINAGLDILSATTSLELVEATPGSLIAGGTVTLTLPAGLQFAAVPTAATGAGLGVSPALLLSADGRTATFNVTTASTTVAGTVTFTFPVGSILVSPTAAAGDVVVAVAGTAGAAGNVTVATVRPVVTVTAAAAPRLSLGVNAQDAGNIVITEAAAGRLGTGTAITLTASAGVTFSGLPTVTRTSGNIVLGTATLTANNILTIPVTTAGTVASVITVSGIKYNVDRAATPEGNITVMVDGTAVANPAVATAFPATVAANRVRVANARIGGVVSSVFTIGALSFLRDGVSTPIDSAPVIVDGRTLLSLRFAAQAVGVEADEIMWDAVRRQVTLIRGDRVVQVRIGSDSMIINGVAVPLEVAPIIINGRTMLPIRAIATALRASVVWDATARTVTVTPN